MLLELRQLANGIATAGITAPRRHDRLVAYPKSKPLFRVTITAQRHVGSVRLISKDRASQLVMYRVSTGGAQESVPGFNIPPLYQAGSGETLPIESAVKGFAARLRRGTGETVESRDATLQTIRSLCTAAWPARVVNKLNLCLGRAVEVLRPRLGLASGSDSETIRPLRTLLDLIYQLEPSQLRAEIAECVERSIRVGESDPDELVCLLQALFTKEAAIMLELDEGEPANHPSVWEAVNRVLVAQEAARRGGAVSTGETGDESLDLFGTPIVDDGSKMPTRRLPRLGDVKLRSHANDQRCQLRYGMSESAACPVAPVNRDALADALGWLTAPEREGRTFRDISHSCGLDNPALLLVYPEALTPTPPALASLLADDGEESDTSGRFEAAARTVTQQLETTSGEVAKTPINIFVLLKADKSRSRVMVSRQFSAARIIDAAREWRAGATNIPPIYFRRFGSDRRPMWGRCDTVPFPTQVSRCLNRVWYRRGMRSERTSTFDFGEELTLFLDEGPLVRDTAGRALSLALTQWPPLLLASADSTARGEVFRPSLEYQLLLPGILGLLLAKCGSRAEDYMNDSPYWIGRLLSLADRAHRHYCRVARDGKLPAGELLGNALMQTCLENPRAGLARLAERLPLYYSVADTPLRQELAEVERHLDRNSLPQRTSDEHKAQMLLGYLARPDLLASQASNASNTIPEPTND